MARVVLISLLRPAECAARLADAVDPEPDFLSPLGDDLGTRPVNPFRTPATDPAWVTANAVVLARTMYESGDFTLMPLLADLLEEAGCPTEVSEHCRGAGPHVRGCWVVDALLGKG